MLRGSFKQKTHNKQNKQLTHYSFSKNNKQNNEKHHKKSINFVDRVNGYLQMISPHSQPTRHNSRQSKSIAVSGKTKKFKNKEAQHHRDSVLEKVKIERQMNRNLQKCVIEIQKMLWERNDRLEQLEEQLRDSQILCNKPHFRDEEEACKNSGKRIRQSNKELKKHANTLGLRQILSKMEDESESEQSSAQNITSSSNSIGMQNEYIKIRRPRTQSQSEAGLSRRRK